ncbi:MAG: glycoside hydrolase family 3 C-terminal domain-containing protein [Tannerellaceae bacterium]|nr:glycoside hydrolase family 3 C-terminal domain-containing protein [Tannerellaceae bacterium]
MKNSLNMFTMPLALVVALLSAECTGKQANDYRNASLSFDERADALVALMSPKEKIDMLRYDSPGIPRLGVPPHNFWNECLHGVARAGKATVFPQAIGMAAMWDREQMKEIATAISDEARAKHHHFAANGRRGIYQGLTFWTPNINIFRDPRWGRGMETYGEDPFLTAETAIPFIRGLQGNHPKYLKTIATAKHFAVHSGPESTRHSFDVLPSDYDLFETYLPHFRRAVMEAGVQSVMCAYQSLRGAPCCGNAFLSGILRDDWGFDGYIVSDCWAIVDFYEQTAHHIADSPEEAAIMALRAGTDLNCGSTYPHLIDALYKGMMKEAELNAPVKRIIKAMLKLGMMDQQENVGYAHIPYSVVESDMHKAISLEAARKSIVLLKNENTLPFSKNIQKVAVIGPNANDVETMLGNYNGFPTNPITPLEGIRAKLPNAEVSFAQGCALADSVPYLLPVPPSCLFVDKDGKQPGLKGEYFNNTNWKGRPAHTRTDSTVNFVWQANAPVEGLNPYAFSARWTGVIIPPVSGIYAIGGEGFSGFSLDIDGNRAAQWNDVHHPRKVYAIMDMEAGKPYTIKLEYVQEGAEQSMMQLLWDTPKPDLLNDALTLAKESDIIILCMGLSPRLEGEEMPVQIPGFNGGDRTDINLPATQSALIREIARLGKPTALVLLNGSALAINWEKEHMNAIVEAWYPGQHGGTAIADVLFGDYNPAGRLPVTFYRSTEQLPPFDDYNMAGKTYRYFTGEPLFEFGEGLSYTQFEYTIQDAPQKIVAGDSLRITVEVKNTGNRDGDEVVQLYVSLPESKLNVPLRSLQGFDRIHLKAGEKRRLLFTLSPEQMAGRDTFDYSKVIPGKALISIGGKQPDKHSLATRRVVQREITITGEEITNPW